MDADIQGTVSRHLLKSKHFDELSAFGISEVPLEDMSQLVPQHYIEDIVIVMLRH